MENQSIILYDGVCNLCNHSVRFVIKRDVKHIFKLASLQSEFGKKILAENRLDDTMKARRIDGTIPEYSPATPFVCNNFAPTSTKRVRCDNDSASGRP